jgi:hypothetical protein
VSRWTHAICAPCYAKLEPGRWPARATFENDPPCCFCGGPSDGIYYRADPDKAPCSGHGTAHEKDEP